MKKTHKSVEKIIPHQTSFYSKILFHQPSTNPLIFIIKIYPITDSGPRFPLHFKFKQQSGNGFDLSWNILQFDGALLGKLQL